MSDESLCIIKSQVDFLHKSLSNEQYTCALVLLNEVSIGKHLRHIYEFYKTITDAYPTGIINYSTRMRNEDVENNLDFAFEVIHAMFEDIDKIDPQLEVEVSHSIKDNIGVKSSYGRELMYAFDHAIHHLAIIKIGASTFKDIIFPQEFGVAPSTLKFQKLSQQ